MAGYVAENGLGTFLEKRSANGVYIFGAQGLDFDLKLATNTWARPPGVFSVPKIDFFEKKHRL